MSRAESIREFRILTQNFASGSGELTPTLELRRQIVMGRYSEAVTDFYDG